ARRRHTFAELFKQLDMRHRPCPAWLKRGKLVLGRRQLWRVGQDGLRHNCSMLVRVPAIALIQRKKPTPGGFDANQDWRLGSGIDFLPRNAAMTYRPAIFDELSALKQETARLLGTRTEEWRQASSQKAHDIAADVKAFLSDFRDAVALEDEEIERAFAGRAAAALASALALGIVIGWA